MCQPKCWLHLLFRPFYKNDQKHAFRILPEVTALNFLFLGRRRCQHHSAHGDCTNRKRRLMQHCLCFLWRYHCSYDLCCSYWWGQRCLPGNRIMIRINIYIWTIRVWEKHTAALLKPLWRFSVQCRAIIDRAVRCTKSHVDFKSAFLFTKSYIIYPNFPLVI